MASEAPTTAPPSANKAELLAIADAVAREKLIDKAIVIEAMEDAIQRAARARYGAENDIRAKLDVETGDLRLWRVLEVVEEAIFAAGDHHNDISMLDGRYAAYPSCPANAIAEVKEAVRRADGRVAENEFGAGVHEALVHFAGAGAPARR